MEIGFHGLNSLISLKKDRDFVINLYCFLRNLIQDEAGGSLLDPKDRINTGCGMMPEVKNCHKK